MNSSVSLQTPSAEALTLNVTIFREKTFKELMKVK
jgi:hypothetical protein